MTAPSNTIERDAYTLKEVSERYGLHPDTIYREIKAGRLEACKVRGRTMIFKNALVAWRKRLPRLANNRG